MESGLGNDGIGSAERGLAQQDRIDRRGDKPGDKLGGGARLLGKKPMTPAEKAAWEAEKARRALLRQYAMEGRGATLLGGPNGFAGVGPGPGGGRGGDRGAWLQSILAGNGAGILGR